MKILCVFGPVNEIKTELTNSLAWLEEAVVLHTADYNFKTIEERLGCIAGVFMDQRWNNHNFVIDVDDDSQEARKLCMVIFEASGSEMVSINASDASFDEGWDEIWSVSSHGLRISTKR